MQHSAKPGAYAIAGLFTVLAGLTAAGAFGGDSSARTLAVLTLTLIAIIWYTAFSFLATQEAQRTAELTRHLAETAAATLREERVRNRAPLVKKLDFIRGDLEQFLRHPLLPRWEAGEELDRRPPVLVNLELLQNARSLAAGQEQELWFAVRDALLKVEDAYRAYQAAEGGLSRDGAMRLKDLAAGAMSRVEAAIEAVRSA